MLELGGQKVLALCRFEGFALFMRKESISNLIICDFRVCHL